MQEYDASVVTLEINEEASALLKEAIASGEEAPVEQVPAAPAA